MIYLGPVLPRNTAGIKAFSSVCDMKILPCTGAYRSARTFSVRLSTESHHAGGAFKLHSSFNATSRLSSLSQLSLKYRLPCPVLLDTHTHLEYSTPFGSTASCLCFDCAVWRRPQGSKRPHPSKLDCSGQCPFADRFEKLPSEFLFRGP